MPKAIAAMDNPAGMAQKLSEKLGNPSSEMKPDGLNPSLNPGTPAANSSESLNQPAMNQQPGANPTADAPPKTDSEVGSMTPVSDAGQKSENTPMPGEKIYPGTSDGQISGGNIPQQPFQNALSPVAPPPPPERNPLNAPLDTEGQPVPPKSPFDPSSEQAQQSQQGAPQQSPQDQAKMAEQQYLQDLSGQPKNSNDAPASNQGAMPQQKASSSNKLGPVPYEALNQVLVDSEPGYRWNALQEINKAGMAPPDTYNLLCQTAMSDSPLMNPDIPLDTQSQLRQAAFSTLALLDNKQDANIPAIALMKDPKTGRAIKDPKTGQPAYQMLPGLQEAGRALHDKEEDPEVQKSALTFLQKIIQAHPSDRPALLGIIKGYKTRDANVQALARQIQSGKPIPGEDSSLDMVNKMNPAGVTAPSNGQAMLQQPQQAPQQPVFSGRVAISAPKKQFIA